MSKPHHHHGNTDFVRKLGRWKLAIDFFLRELRTIILSIASIIVALGVVYNHEHSASLHHVTQQRLDRLENTISNLELKIDLQPDNGAVGFNQRKSTP